MTRRTARVARLTVALLAIAASGVVVYVAHAPSYTACSSGKVSSNGFWYGLQTHSVDCGHAHAIAREWLVRFAAGAGPDHRPLNPLQVGDYRCRVQGHRESALLQARVTCANPHGLALRFYDRGTRRAA